MEVCKNCKTEVEALGDEGLCGPCYINKLAEREDRRAGTPDRRRPIKRR